MKVRYKIINNLFRYEQVIRLDILSPYYCAVS